MRISDWSSDVCSSDLATRTGAAPTCCCARLVRGEQARAGAPGRGLLALSAVLRRSWSRLRAGRRARTTRLRISTISAEKAKYSLKHAMATLWLTKRIDRQRGVLDKSGYLLFDIGGA